MQTSLAPPLRLRLFGAPTVEHGDAVRALPFERRSQLIVLLALRRGWTPRAEAASLLWPEHEARLAFTNLRKTLFRLPALGPALAVEAQGAALRFEPATDVVEFESALREQRADDVLALYRGELLAGFDDGQREGWTRWVGFERERLRTSWRAAALARLADLQQDAGTAIALATRLLEADPLDEAALRALLAWQRRDGQAGAARQAWQAFVQRLRDELDLEPGAELRALEDTLGLPVAAAPPERTGVRDDSFVGRSVECQRIGALLVRDDCRLLCLVGPGGIGKTRLARRTVAELAPQFADGALFVELEDAATTAQVGVALARAAGAGRGSDALTQAIEALRQRHALLVLDNVEQLDAPAPLLERLLQSCPRLKLLVTSRVRLPVAGEWSMPVEGLPWPEPEDEDRADAFDAVRLFVKAAQRVEPAFHAASQQHAIVDICRQVEGLPLAIELAAAWVRLLSCEAIAAELRRGSELLRAQDAAHPARHASIEQVFEQSWQRLSARERDALARLSVFRGGFTPEAARAVADASLPVLGALVDKSLLRKDEGARLRLHPLMQQLSADKLSACGNAAAAQRAHADYALRWVARLRGAIEDGQREALQALDQEFENCRIAWLHAAHDGRLDMLRASSRALLNYCDYRGRIEDGMALLRDAMDAPACQAEVATWAGLLAQVAHLEYRIDRYDAAQASAERALAALRKAPANDAQIQALTVLASCALQTGRLLDARALYQRALALAPPDLLAHNTAAVLGNLALVEKRLGNYPQALRLHIESLAQHRRIGDGAGVALCLNNLATMYMLLGQWDAAAVHLAECLSVAERDGLVAIQSYARTNLADVARQRGDLDAATLHIERGLELSRSVANRGTEYSLLLQRARIAVRRGDLVGARSALAQGLAGAMAIGMPSLQSDAVLCFAELLEAQGQAALARRVLAFGMEHPATLPADRNELRAQWKQRAAATIDDPPWPDMGRDELLQRIVAEHEVAHAPLIGALGGVGL